METCIIYTLRCILEYNILINISKNKIYLQAFQFKYLNTAYNIKTYINKGSLQKCLMKYQKFLSGFYEIINFIMSQSKFLKNAKANWKIMRKARCNLEKLFIFSLMTVLHFFIPWQISSWIKMSPGAKCLKICENISLLRIQKHKYLTKWMNIYEMCL